MTDRTCPECDSVFVPNVHNQKFCGKRCKDRHFNRKWYQANKEATIAQVAAWRAANRDRRNATDRARYATDPTRYRLAETRRRWERSNRDKTRSYRQKRDARLRSLTIEDFTDVEIFERDKWVCQLCGRRVDRRLKYPHPQAASLDHIIPISEPGSSHTRKNVQLAHFGCNAGKSNRPAGEQLRLIG